MAADGVIAGSAEPRHIGVAVEGHCRSMLSRSLADGQVMERALPFPTVANPDAVVTDRDGSVVCLAIIAQWQKADSSHKKYYRTLAEYNSIQAAWKSSPETFSASFLPLTVIYGAPSGWKEEVLANLRSECPYLMFLPELLGAEVSERLTSRAFEVYSEIWGKNQSNAREATEAFFANPENLNDDDLKLLDLFKRVLADEGIRTAVHRQLAEATPVLTSARVPHQPFRTRYRQGLVAASLFPADELAAWLTENRQTKAADVSQAFAAFTRRAYFLDLVTEREVRRIGRIDIRVEPRRPEKMVGNRVHYAAELLDFESWSNVEADLAEALFKRLREHAVSHPKVFAGGLRDLAYGNWTAIADAWMQMVPTLCEALEAGNRSRLIESMNAPQAQVFSEPWQVSGATPPGLPVVRQLAIAALATAVENRSQLRDLGIRSISADSSNVAEALLLADRSDISQLLAATVDFVERIRNADLGALANLQRPALMSLSNSASWISSVYGNITTNSTFSPLLVALRDYVWAEYGQEPQGWPRGRGVSLRSLVPETVARVEWSLAIPDGPQGQIILAEAKSVTANHWGDKSKEIYARAAKTRQIVRDAGLEVLLIGVLDGDVDAAALEELETGLGYDIVLSAQELLMKVADDWGIETPLSQSPDGDF